MDCATLVLGAVELRLARLRGVLDQRIRCTGWPLSGDRPIDHDAGNGWSAASLPDGLTSAVAWVSPVAGTSATVSAGPHRHALGDHVALPWLETGSGSTGQVCLAWLVHLGRHWDRSLPGRITVRWLPDGADVAVDGSAHHCGWLRESPWAADEENQGIFRVGSAPLER